MVSLVEYACHALFYSFLTFRPTGIDFDTSTTLDEYGMALFASVLCWWAMSSPWFLGVFTFYYFQLILGLKFIFQELIMAKLICEQNRSAAVKGKLAGAGARPTTRTRRRRERGEREPDG